MFRGWRDRFDRWQLARARQAYCSVSGHRSAAEGMAGMVEEMQWGLRHLDDEARREADDRVLESVFVGAAGLLRGAYRRWPRPTTRMMAAASPLALRWLVGRVEAVDDRNVIVRCTFREAGGTSLCEAVCRAPSERFCGERVVPVSLAPEEGSLRCHWRWGEG